MELKTARLTLLIDPNKKAAFERLCASQDLTPSQVVRRMIRDYLAQHGASYEPAGSGEAAIRKAGSRQAGTREGGTLAPPRAPAGGARGARGARAARKG